MTTDGIDDYWELQRLAMLHGIPGNLSSSEIRERLDG